MPIPSMTTTLIGIAVVVIAVGTTTVVTVVVVVWLTGARAMVAVGMTATHDTVVAGAVRIVRLRVHSPFHR